MNDPLFISQLNYTHSKGEVTKGTLKMLGKVIILLSLLVGAYILGSRTATTNSSTTSKTSIAKPYFTKVINQNFSFPVKDTNGNVLTNVDFTVVSANLQDQIILQGQRANAIAGRTFLILNLKIKNTSAENIQINSRNFIRISIDNNNELLAPEIYNDPITIQPISTKYTQLGLPLDASIKDIKLHVGEINGSKKIIDVLIKR